MYGVKVENNGYHLPPGANRSYRYALYDNERRVSVSSEYSWDSSNCQLVDGKPETYWKIAPPEVGKTAWVLFDLGSDGARAVRSLSALPRTDRPEEFFREAELKGSRDGLHWEKITDIEQDESPLPGEWLRWSFDNPSPYRFYRLEIESGHVGRMGNFISLAELRLGK